MRNWCGSVSVWQTGKKPANKASGRMRLQGAHASAIEVRVALSAVCITLNWRLGCMTKLWLLLVPDLRQVETAKRKDALKQASRSGLTGNELIAMAVWLVVVSIITQAVLKGATEENRLTFTIVTNLIITAPLLLAVFIPIHIRRIRRGIRRRLGH